MNDAKAKIIAILSSEEDEHGRQIINSLVAGLLADRIIKEVVEEAFNEGYGCGANNASH
jgi:hypothetical protein